MPSQRSLDRLEQMLEKCLRADENSHATDERIRILIDAQTKYEEDFGKIVDRSARRNALFARYKEHRAKSDDLDKDPFTEILISIQKELQDWNVTH